MREHGVPAVHGRRAPAGARVRPVRHLVRDRARLHEHADRAGPGRDPAARPGPDRGGPDRGRRRARRVQPGADRRLHRRRGAGRRRGGGRRDHRDRPGVEGRGRARAAGTSCCCAWPAPRRSTCPASTTWTTCRDGRIQRVVPNRADVPFRIHKRTTMDLDEWPYPRKPLVPLAETVHERYAVEIFRGCTRGCRFCQAGMITRPVRERSITTVGQMVHDGLEFSGFSEVGPALAVQRRPLRDRRHLLRPGRAVRGDQRLPVAAVDPGGRVQRDPGPGAVPQRPPDRADLRPRGRVGADPQGDQQDGHRGGPDPHGRHRVHQRLAAT